MNIDEWATRDWILRGLACSCLAADDLYNWYTQRAKPVSYYDFLSEMAGLAQEGLIYVQRQVPSRKMGERVDGFALTEAGTEAEPLARERRERETA